MESEPDPNYQPDFFVCSQDSPVQYAGNFKVRWVVKGDFKFHDLDFMPPNPMNEDMPIKQSKNGQELPFKMGNYLCHLIYNQKDPNKKILCPLDKLNRAYQLTMNKDGGQMNGQQHENRSVK